jgi:diketogulonate reductase-like aldo/keto reductase
MIEGRQEAERQAVAALRVGLDLGMTHIDTAEMYGDGRAEELVGEAIAGRRQEVFLASKVLPSNASYEGTQRACERSLKRLRTDYLDLYLLHWRGRIPLAETMRAMEALAAAGKIRFFGVSNFDVDDLRDAEQELAGGRIASNQVLYHLQERGIERRLIPYCAGRGIAVVGYTPFGRGKFPSPSSKGGRVLAAIAQRNGKTPRQVILNFLTRLPGVFTIPKASNPEHVRENSQGAGWELSAEDIACIEEAFPVPDRDRPLAML